MILPVPATKRKSCVYPLFDAHPALAEKLPRLALSDWPTPVQQAGGFDGKTAVYIKRDDMGGTHYGGNKVRKLELLLAAAKTQGHKAVLTFGGAGSNHAFATALYAREAGLRAILVLGPQANTPSVRRALLRDMDAGADLRHCPSYDVRDAWAEIAVAEYAARDGVAPYVIPPGGSSPLGAIGFVNAAFELKRQVDAGEMPAPDVVYTASGTMGTTVGLAVGLYAAGLSARVVATSVTEPPFSSIDTAKRLCGEMQRILRASAPDFPEPPFETLKFTLREDFYAPGYGIPTHAALEAIATARDAAGIALEPVYTGRAFAAFLSDLREGLLDGKCALFWNTYNSRPLPEPKATVTDLPETARFYFTTPDTAVAN